MSNDSAQTRPVTAAPSWSAPLLALFTRQRLWAAFIIYLLAWTLLHCWRQSAELQPFSYGDWIIHYKDMFVRRGLIGQIVLILGGPANAPTLVFGIKALAYVVFFGAVYAIFKPLLNNSIVVICLLAPMGLSFSVIDSWGAGRKEILLLAILAVQVFCLPTAKTKSGSSNLHFALLVASLSFAVLSHEALIFFSGFPLLVFYLQSRAQIGGASATRRLVLVMVWLIALVLVQVAFPGSQEQANRICAALGAQAPVKCAEFSAVSWLASNGRFAVIEVLRVIAAGQLFVYAATAALSALPLYMLWISSQAATTTCINPSQIRDGLIAAIALTLPPYLVGVDWGRWQYITFCSVLLVLGHCYRQGFLASTSLLERAHAELAAFGALRTILMPLLWLLVAVYVLAWNAPHVGNNFDKGHIGFIERLAGHASKALAKR